MKNDQSSDGFKAMQQAFGEFAPLNAAWGTNWANYWRSQDKVLDSMQEFALGWFERRHEAAKSAVSAAQRSCEAHSPADVAREYQAWMTGSMQRLAADGLALQRHLMAMTELAGAAVQRNQGQQSNDSPGAPAGKGTEKHAEAA